MSHENDAFLWDNQSWANLSNDIPDNSGGDKAVSLPEPKEEKGKKRGRGAPKKGKGVKEGGEASDHGIHIWTERERRKKMRNMFTNLQEMLPQLPPKTDKTTIVEEAVNYIKILQSTVQRLEKQQLERDQGWTTNPLPFEPSVAANSRLAMFSTRESFMADQVSSMNYNNINPTNVRTSNTFSGSAAHLPVAIRTWTSKNVVLNICGNDALFAIYAPKRPALLTTICCVFEKYKVEPLYAQISADADRIHYMIRARIVDEAINQLPESVTVEDVYRHAAGEIVLWVAASSNN